MKIGDLVRFQRGYDLWMTNDKSVGVISELSEPTPMFPFQVATVIFGTQVFEGVSVRSLEVINADR